ncbi:hypothetical protein [Magnetospirillum sp. 64-120]|uniref:hypothetical protein n=1 Tax=Magnetospirillum sp. 64-120 TaxID=1895778 RepID=UPI00092CBFEC|nr:hypothetical protein [Magnetospirillum sp. 64-120]OJX79283.1 MAG: hypothetical protein BGO92_12365 [Magnetospirillum sp. 64-120]
MIADTLSHASQCYPPRVERVAAHVDRGEWACGHAIANGMMQCANAGGCPARGECTHAAQHMMGMIRSILKG